MDNWLQLLIGGTIVAAVLFSVWRNGRRNPESTGRLARRIADTEKTVAAQGGRLQGVEDSIRDLASSAARRADIEVLRAEVAGDRAITERTWGAVDRLQNYFIQDAFDRRNPS